MSTDMIQARERLARWFEQTGLSQAAAAEKIGCTQGALSRALSGERGVGLELASLFETATEGWSEGPILASEWSKEASPVPARKRRAAS
jgi:transcriptional regulator with XRE-family HTH domain